MLVFFDTRVSVKAHVQSKRRFRVDLSRFFLFLPLESYFKIDSYAFLPSNTSPGGHVRESPQLVTIPVSAASKSGILVDDVDGGEDKGGIKNSIFTVRLLVSKCGYFDPFQHCNLRL